MTTILSNGHKTYTDRRSTMGGTLIKRLLHGTGYSKATLDIARKIYLINPEKKIPVTTDRNFFDLKEGEELPIIVAFCMAGDAEVARIVFEAVKYHGDSDFSFAQVLRIVGESRVDLGHAIRAVVVTNTGRLCKLTMENTNSTSVRSTGELIDQGDFTMMGSGQKYWHNEVKYTEDQQKDLFLACCYLDESSSIIYDEFDLAANTLKTVVPAQEEIKQAMTNVGLGGLWIGPKAVLCSLDKK